MKGIILETRDNEAAILSDDGDVSKIINKNYKLGQVITMKKEKNFNSKFITKVAGIAAVFAITVVSGFAYATPTSYVSLDVNPSIEYSLNAFDRVLYVTAVNEDGEKIIVDLDVKNNDIAKAIQKTVDKLIEGGYIANDENAGVIIAASNSNKNKADKLATDLQDDTQKYINKKGETAKVEAEAVGKARVEQAKVLGVTPGKLNLVEKLVVSSEGIKEIDAEEFKNMLNMPVKEINKAIKENRETLKNAETVIGDVETEDVDDKEIKAATDIGHDKRQNAIQEKSKIQSENKPIKNDKVEDEEDVNDDVKSNNSKSENSKK